MDFKQVIRVRYKGATNKRGSCYQVVIVVGPGAPKSTYIAYNHEFDGEVSQFTNMGYDFMFTDRGWYYFCK